MPKEMKSYRLRQDTIFMLNYITTITDINETGIIEYLIGYAHNLIKSEEMWKRNSFTDEQIDKLRAYYTERLLSDLNPKI